VLNWLPQIVQAFTGSSDFTMSLHSAIPYAVACVALLLVGRHSDRTGERRWHAAASYFVGTCGLLLSLWLEQPAIAPLGLVLAISGIQSATPGFFGLWSTFVTGVAAVTAFALINSVGNLGGLVGPYLVGVLADTTGSQGTGLFVMAVFPFLASMLIAVAGRGVNRPAAARVRPDARA
jgi:MFS transporter, ACS family, tartrate transporter